jgi:hypothetical protein
MHGFETILPFPRPIEHLILDDSVSEVMMVPTVSSASAMDSYNRFRESPWGNTL